MRHFENASSSIASAARVVLTEPTGQLRRIVPDLTPNAASLLDSGIKGLTLTVSPHMFRALSAGRRASLYGTPRPVPNGSKH